MSFINKFTQNGELINRLVRKKFPQYKVLLGDQRSIRKLLAQTYMLEKFHCMMFLLFTLVMIYALMKNYLWWAFFILTTNVVFNIYPVFLQQYIRVKLKALRKHV